MNLANSKNCGKCVHSISYGAMGCKSVECNSEDYTCRNLFERDGVSAAIRCKGYTVGKRVPDGMISQDKALQFMTAGKAEFVLHSTKTNQDFKFSLTRQESRDQGKESENNEKKYIYFLNYLHGHEKTYAGVVWFKQDTGEFMFSTGKNGQMSPKDLEIRSLIFVMNKLYREETVQYLDVFHVGKCGKCGKKLTTPESILTGLGPTCSKNSGIPRIKYK